MNAIGSDRPWGKRFRIAETPKPTPRTQAERDRDSERKRRQRGAKTRVELVDIVTPYARRYCKDHQVLTHDLILGKTEQGRRARDEMMRELFYSKGLEMRDLVVIFELPRGRINEILTTTKP